MPVLYANARLQSVVVEVSFVFLLVYTAEAREYSIEVRVELAGGNALTQIIWIDCVVWIRQRQRVNLPPIILVPARGANILQHRNDRWSKFLLNPKAIVHRARRWIPEFDVGQC